MCTCTSTPVRQLSNSISAVPSVPSVSFAIHVFGYHDWHIQQCVRFDCTPLELFTLSFAHAAHSPSSDTLCASNALSLAFLSCLHHTGALAGVSADFHALSSPSLTQPSSPVPHPARSFCQPQRCHSRLLRLLLCPVWHTWHVR